MVGLKSLVLRNSVVGAMTCLAVGLGLGSGLGLAPEVAAQPVWPGYFVNSIQTKAVAGTGADAQDIAFRNARLAGLREVASRMVCSQSQELLRIPSDADLQAMVQSLELTDQKIIGNSYSGLLNIAFDPGLVKSYLNNQRAAFAMDPAPTQLAIPILRMDNGPAQAFDDDLWAEIWSQGPNRAFLQSYNTPDGDEEDAATFDPELPSSTAAQFLIEKYGFTGGLVVTASVTTGPEGEPMDLFVDAVRVGVGFGPSRLEVALVADEGESLDSLLRRAAEDVQIQASATYCDTTKAEVQPVFSINVVVIGTDISTWVQIEELLRAQDGIQSITLVGERQGAIDISVRFVGGLESLQQIFGSVSYRFLAYTTQQTSSDATQIFFFAQPDFQPLPNNVRILQMGDIQLAN